MISSVFKKNANIEVIPIRYGFFDIFRFMFPFFTRRGPLKRIVRELIDIRTEYPTAKISIIAHSFGTYTLVRALELEPSIKLNRIIFCGSIVQATFRKSRYRGQLSGDPILNDCGTDDLLPILAQSATWGYDATGVFGFGTVGVKDRFSKLGHSEYFKESYVKDFWLPFIVDGVIVENEFQSKREAPPYWHSVLARLPLRWLLAAIPAFFLWAALKDVRWPESRFVVASSNVLISNYFGAPNVLLRLNFLNSRISNQWIAVHRVSLKSPDGRTFPMRIDGNVMENPDDLCWKRHLWTATQSWLVSVGESAYFFSFVGATEEYNAFLMRTNDELSQMSFPNLPCRPSTSLKLLSEDYAAQLKEFAARQWIWRVGNWQMTVEYGLNNNERKEFIVEFGISEADIACMKEVLNHYQSGLGVFNQWRMDFPSNVCGIVIKEITN
jgi:hypothetical protein